MLSRRAVSLAVATTTLAAGFGYAGPAAASVRYDPVGRSGFAGAADVRGAFGWSDAELAARADGLMFGHEFWTTDTYALSCGEGSFAVPHRREFGRYELTVVVLRRPGRGATGYDRGRPTGFRIDGPYAGISGTSAAPAVGQPCPEPRGPRITRARLVGTSGGWALTVGSGELTRTLRSGTAEAGPLPGQPRRQR